MAKICKFQIEKRQVSYDCGEVWEDTGETRKIEGQEPVERYSYDCGWSDSFLYRWVETTDETVCVGYHKYSKKYQEVSYNQGVDWEIVEGSEQPGTLMEKFSSDCCQLRTVSGETCDEFFRYVNASIEEASLDGETWVQTGRYTVNSVISAASVDCMNEYDVKYLGVPVSGTSGYSLFEYNEYTDSTATKAYGWDSGYVLIKCGEDEDYSDDNGGYQDAHLPQIEEIYVGDCAVTPTFTTRSQSTLKKIHISSGATGSLGGVMHRFDPHSGRSGKYNFKDCTALTDIEGLGESKITGIPYATFSGCTSLKEVTIPYTCRQIEYCAFKGCTSLTSVTIYSRSLVSGREEEAPYSLVGYEFSGCTSLQTVTFPQDYYGIIGEGMFDHCTSLTGVTLGNPSEVIGFYGCTSLTEIDLGNRVKRIGSFASCTSLTDVYIESTEDVNVSHNSFPSGTTIHVPCEKYDYWRNLLPESNPIDCFNPAIYRTTSGTPYCTGADKYVDIYTQVSYDSGTTWETVSSTTEVVEYDSPDCSNFKFKCKYSNGKSYSLDCDSGTTLTTDDTRPNKYIYAPHSAMTSAEIGRCITTIGGGALSECVNLTSVTIPNSVTYIQTSAFNGDVKLTSIDIPSGVTGIGSYAFSNCRSLTSVDIPNNVTQIGFQTFYCCSGLTRIDIPDSVTYIGGNAFSRCTGATACTIGSGVTSMESGVFYYSSGLTSITITALTPPELGNGVFDQTNNCPIYVPSSVLDTYKHNTYWIQYSSRIQAIQT